jgi:hypothetical protein
MVYDIVFAPKNVAGCLHSSEGPDRGTVNDTRCVVSSALASGGDSPLTAVVLLTDTVVVLVRIIDVVVLVEAVRPDVPQPQLTPTPPQHPLLNPARFFNPKYQGMSRQEAVAAHHMASPDDALLVARAAAADSWRVTPDKLLLWQQKIVEPFGVPEHGARF